MADVEHGDNLPADHAGANKGNHTVEAYNSFLDEAARNAEVQTGVDRGREVFQTAGVQPGWYRALGITGSWIFIGGATGPAAPQGFIAGLVADPGSTSEINITTGAARSDDNSFNLIATSTLTADIAVSGANGLDAGVEAANTWYSVWVIGDSTGVNATASLLSISPTAPTLPGGYDKKRRVGWTRNDASSNFIPFANLAFGVGRAIRYDSISETILAVLIGGANTAFTNVDLSGVVPPTSEAVDLLVAHEGATLADGVFLRPDGETVVDPVTQMRSGVSGGADSVSSMEFRMRCSASQVIEYANFLAANSTDIWVLGYLDDL